MKPLNKHNQWKINEEITAPSVRVISAQGTQVGVMAREEALALAKKEGVDLVVIVDHVTPPIVKLIDFGKFRYQEEKRERQEKRKAKSSEVKEIRFSPFIGQTDFDTRIKRIEEFLDDSNKVRVVVVFKNRQISGKQFGYDIMAKIKEIFVNRIVVDMEPKFLGRHLAMVISPYKKAKKQINQNESQNQKISNQEIQSNLQG